MKNKIHDMIFTRIINSFLSWNKYDRYGSFDEIWSLRWSNSQFHDFMKDTHSKLGFDARDLHDDESTEEDFEFNLKYNIENLKYYI